MIIGSHTIIQSKDADADRVFLRDVLGLNGIDSGGGWLIFGLPPSELAVHPSSKNDVHEHYLICDDVTAFVANLAKQGVACSPIQDQNWGRLTQVTLPGGGKLGVYQAMHARPETSKATSPRKKTVKRPTAKGASKKKTAKRAKKAAPAKKSAKRRAKR
jgi:hypothetical protein